MEIAFDKCVWNVTPVTNPTPMSKSDKQIVKTIKFRFSPKIILARFLESFVKDYAAEEFSHEVGEYTLTAMLPPVPPPPSSPGGYTVT